MLYVISMGGKGLPFPLMGKDRRWCFWLRFWSYT